MKDAKLQQVILSDNVGLYSISFNGDLTEYRKFVENFKGDAKLNSMSDQVLIVGNGGVKDTKTYEESEELSGYVMDLQKFEKLLKQAMSEGTISIERNVITGIEEAVFKV